MFLVENPQALPSLSQSFIPLSVVPNFDGDVVVLKETNYSDFFSRRRIVFQKMNKAHIPHRPAPRFSMCSAITAPESLASIFHRLIFRYFQASSRERTLM